MAEAAPAAATTSPHPMKIITGADSFGCSLKDALVSHLRSLNIEVEDLGTSSYYDVGAEVGRRVSTAEASPGQEVRGLLACGTGVGVSIMANKFPGVAAATCLSTAEAVNARSINNSNVLSVSGMYTDPSTAVDILDAWLRTPFNSPCPASGNKPWPPEIQAFFQNSLIEMPKIGKPVTDNYTICSLVKDRQFNPVDVVPGMSMKILRENPASAFVRLEAGTVQPAHHHTCGDDLVVTQGKVGVSNLTTNHKYDVGVGDHLFTPGGDVLRVQCSDDTEVFIKWDGHWDMFMDEDLETAKKAVVQETPNGSL